MVVRSGVYGDRFFAIAERAGIPTVAVHGDWAEPISVEAVIRGLNDNPEVDAIAVVHHETTTGVLNPLAAIAAVAKAAGVRLVVDAISSFGGERIEVADSGIDFLTCSSNKCLGGLPGAAFVLISPEGRARLAEVPPRSVYLDLAAYLKATDTGVVPFTPAIPALRSLDAALDEIFEEGVERRIARLAARAERLDAELAGLGLEQMVAPAHRSASVRCLRLPAGVRYEHLHSRLKRDGYVIYAGQAHLAPDVFRVCCMGTLEPAVLSAFSRRMEAALAGEEVRV